MVLLLAATFLAGVFSRASLAHSTSAGIHGGECLVYGSLSHPIEQRLRIAIAPNAEAKAERSSATQLEHFTIDAQWQDYRDFDSLKLFDLASMGFTLPDNLVARSLEAARESGGHRVGLNISNYNTVGRRVFRRRVHANDGSNEDGDQADDSEDPTGDTGNEQQPSGDTEDGDSKDEESPDGKSEGSPSSSDDSRKKPSQSSIDDSGISSSSSTDSRSSPNTTEKGKSEHSTTSSGSGTSTQEDPGRTTPTASLPHKKAHTSAFSLMTPSSIPQPSPTICQCSGLTTSNRVDGINQANTSKRMQIPFGLSLVPVVTTLLLIF